MFIAIEGIDGAGKATQAKLLASWLENKGYEVFLTQEPTGGEIGKLIKKILSSNKSKIYHNSEVVALLFAADRAEHVKKIKKELKKGKVVISERYLHSSLAYQSASGLSIRWIKEINKFAIPPNIIIYLDIPAEIGIKRIASRDVKELFEKKEFLTKVRESYLKLLEKENNVILIDASQEIKKVQKEIRNKLAYKFPM